MVNETFKNTPVIRTVCKKCKSIVTVVTWSPFGSDYICPKCGYVSRDNTERFKYVKDKQDSGLNTGHTTKSK